MSVANQRLEGIKIARVSTVAFFVETQLRAQIAAFAQAGAEVTIVASEEALRQDVPQTHYVSIEIPRKISLFRDLVALIKLWVLFRGARFEIVHSTTPKAGLLCCLAAKLAGVPVRLHTFTGQPWVGLNGVKRFLSKVSEKLIARFCTHCYADSISQRAFLVENGIARLDRVSVLGSGSLAGVDLERFNPSRFSDDDKRRFKSELGIALDAEVLLFVGRLTRDKGVSELLAAYEKVLAAGASAFLVLLGPKEDEVDSFLDGLPGSAKERLVMPGFSSEPERFMAIADILVLPSYREGFGTVVIEAAAMGVPTIGTDIYGLSDAIVDGKTGLLVPVKTVRNLAEAISALLKNSELRLQLASTARRRVEREFSSTRVNQMMIEEYANLLIKNSRVLS